MNSFPIKVSVLILCYNQEKFILQTLNSVCNQETDFNYEIIIGDDGSSDNTRNICQKYIENSSKNIKLFPAGKNVGLIENYKRLIEVGEGQYIACCAGDDYWSNIYKLQMQVDFLDQNSGYGMVHTHVDILYNEENVLEKSEGLPPSGQVLDELLKRNFVGAVSAMYKTVLVKSAIIEGIFDKGFLMEDYPLWLYIAERAKIGFIPKSTAVWRKMKESVSNTQDVNKSIRFASSVVDIQYFFAKRNNMMAQINSTILAGYRSVLSSTYNHQFFERGKITYNKIKRITTPTMEDRIKLLGSRYKWVFVAVKILLRRN